MAFSIVLLLGLIIVPALLAGIIILLVKGGPAVRWFFGIFLLLLVIGFFGLFFVRAGHVPHPVAVTQLAQPEAQLQGTTVHVDKNPTVWAEGLEEELMPDVYSGLETAAYGLGVQLKDTIDDLSHAPKKITILESGGDDLALLENFRRGLQFGLPDADIRIASDIPSGTQTDENLWFTLWIRIKHQQDTSVEITIPEKEISADYIHMAQTLHVGNQRGSLQAIIQTTDNKYAKQVEYDYRSWLQDIETFRSHVTGHGPWAVITSEETAVTMEQSRQELYNNANKYVYEHLLAMGPVKQTLLLSDLTTHGLIVDEYDQRLQGLSGPIWRSALLLDVSPERIQILRRNKVAINQIQRKTWIFQVISLVGMLALISVLYLFVNAITKGYYSTTILIVAVIAFLVFLLLFHA